MAHIRLAVWQDLDSLVELLKALFCIEEDFQFDVLRQRRGLEMMLANPQGCILVAEENAQVIGMCTGQLTISTAEGGYGVLVEDVVVRKDYRGLGVGTLLVNGIAEWAGSKNISRLQLLADNKNVPAFHFYKSIGWKKTNLICLRKFI